MKLVVIGLDGASFELIDPWIKEGSLPNIKKVKEQGVWGDMRSVLPPVTSPNWKCYSTGKNPGKIGIFWWENIDCANKNVYYPYRRLSINYEIWDYLGNMGEKVGIMGMPTTFPPKKVNGFMISGPPDAADEGFTFPKELEKTLKEDYDYKVNPDTYEPARIHELIDQRFKVGKALLDKYNLDFFQITIFHINALQHHFWNATETKQAWRIVDGHLEDLLNIDSNIILMSDHGCNEIKYVFNINTWLEKEGYLNPNISLTFSRFLKRIGFHQENLLKIVTQLKIKNLLKKMISKRTIDKFPTDTGSIGRGAKKSKIDWENSKAIASGQGPIYLTVDKNDVEYEKLGDEIIKKLEKLRHPKTGERVINKVYKKEEIYSGKYLTEAPDLIMEPMKGVHIPAGVGMNEVFDSPKKWKAENKREGFFIAYGSLFKKGWRIKNFSILDLAPTILYIYGCPIPPDMDGKILKEAFREKVPS